MPTLTYDTAEFTAPTETEVASARQSSRQLESYLETNQGLALQIVFPCLSLPVFLPW